MNINEIITSISLLVVFVTILFNYFVPKAEGLIDFDINSISTSKSKLKKKKKKIDLFIWFNWIFPIVSLNIATLWMLIPDAIKIVKTYDFNILNFDTIPTVFMLITFYLIVFVFISVIKLIMLFSTRKKINEKIKGLP